MKILFYIDSLASGGSERTVVYLANYLVVQKNVEVQILLNRNLIFYEVDKAIKINIVPNISKSNNIFIRFKNVFSRYNYLRKVKKNFKPDIVFSLLYKSLIFSLFLRGVKKVGSERANPNKNSLIVRLLKKISYFYADGMIFQTTSVRELYSKRVKKKSVVIPNGIGSQAIYNLPMIDYEARKNYIVAIGRLVNQKGFDLLLTSFKNFLKEHPNYYLKIYGNGIEKETLVMQAKVLGINEKVHFMGVKDNIFEEIYDAKLFVLSSRFEGMPNVLMESIASGIPSVSADCDYGPRDIIVNEYNGLLFKVEDVQSMTNAMSRMINDKLLAIKCSRNGRELLKSNSVDVISEKFYDYLTYINNGDSNG